jgi:hypothetical protein
MSKLHFCCDEAKRRLSQKITRCPVVTLFLFLPEPGVLLSDGRPDAGGHRLFGIVKPAVIYS